MTMASFTLEKAAILSVENQESLGPSQRTTQRRRILQGLVALVILSFLSFLIIATAFSGCSAPTFSLRTHGIFQVNPAEHNLRSQTINSRSPALDLRNADAATSTTSTAAAERTVLKTFEVDQPVLMPDGPAESDGSTRSGKDYSPELCTVLLMRHDFAWSYGVPFVGDYSPPDCKFNRVVLNFSVVSEGRQYDRLAIMYFGDTEVWRTSTAEPTAHPGISWIYLKDMTQYLYFWRSPQKIIFDLGNLINDKYTGIFNTTMTAIFFHSDIETDQAPPSDLIIPISARQGANNSVSQFTLPTQNATNTISFPRNARRAIFSVSANGQASEEFWWSNVPETDVSTFSATAGELPGLSPFREVQVLIDGQLAGVQWPFPVIFTGGVVPSLHRPIVGIEAFDLREHEIDITPFLPLLCDGKQHTFTIRVAGLNGTGKAGSTSLTETVNESWYVTGKIFVWLDDPSSITIGEPPSILDDPPAIHTRRSLTRAANGTNQTLNYITRVSRSFKITSRNIRSQHQSAPVTWTQDLTYVNNGLVSAFGYSQLNDVRIAGEDQSLLPDSRYLARYSYPLFANQSYAVSPQGNLSIWAHVKQGKEVAVSGASVFPSGLEAFAGRKSEKGQTAMLRTTKEGTAEFRQTGDGTQSTGWGDASQVFWFGTGKGRPGLDQLGGAEELYYRSVKAVNGSVVEDVKRMEGRDEQGAVGGTSSTSGGDGKGTDGIVSYVEW
ncbi:peptide N-acetyl-beta-D-glucosaminyl asparaginase amidase A-domain-containing protein [Chaetomium strumarium]|uniref:Peptide N-acetyl-beta-D-glucosaminyl asparaginase amidase A-domain-containing protein n=1 Tax=Chaetomium strumarium TaxID=1170767 RepID=A0AAJ0H087_9PEZI|nr:peptide N-acetyl-beta-D-glucosaminyl asparaginase amidase A-domain-containing protein [Chaetomium strumarium]